MKIRQDFVTNSSSVSYIITMHKPTVDGFYDKHQQTFSNSKKRVIELLNRELTDMGTRNLLDGVEIYTEKFKFRTDGETMCEDDYDLPIDDIDFDQLPDQDVWALIYGEYIQRQKIIEVNGFGVTQVNTY